MTGVRVAELLGGLSVSCDLADGFAAEKCLRTAILAVRLAKVGGADATAAYWATLLRFLGCTAFAHEEGPLSGGDDIGLRRTLAMVDFGSPVSFARAALTGIAAHASLPVRARALGRLLGDPTAPVRHAAAQCEVGAAFARAIGIPGVAEVLAVRDERWDGRGPTGAVAGDALPLAARVADVADVAELFGWNLGMSAATAELRRRRGGQLDPDLVDAFLGVGPSIWEGLSAASVWDLYLDAEPEPHRVAVDTADVDRCLRAWASFADISSVYTLGHSERVAAVADAAMAALGAPGDDRDTARRAGWVHDLGRVAVPVGIWEKPGPLSAMELERVRQHSIHTESILRVAPALRTLADVAGATHERGAGRGYHRRLHLMSEPLATRVLAAADVHVALSSARPHRPAFPPDAAARELAGLARSGELDPRAVDAVLVADGHRSRRLTPGALTDREVEVARLVAIGRTNPEIGALLGISPRTAQKHVMNVYAKVGRESRAGLALWVVEHGLLDG